MKPNPQLLSESQPRIAHELPRRLRLRFPLLGDPHLDRVYLKSYLEALEGVEGIRVNRHTRCLVVNYDGRTEVKNRVLEQLSDLPLDRMVATDGIRETGEFSLYPIIVSSLTLLSLPLLPLPLRAAMTCIAISGTVFKGIATLFSRGLKVEVLDALAVSFATCMGHYYSANVTHLLLQTGDYVEHQTERHTDYLLKTLLRRPPEGAWVERDGVQMQVNAGEIHRGETVIVGAGDSIPVDGRVRSGTALVNQASLTGESTPVRKEQGSRVLAGTIVVEGHLRINASQVGDQTSTARITAFVEQALQRPSESQRLADQLADRLVYSTFGISGLLYVLTLDLRRLASVFLVDYSCALKLGTPAAFKAGMHRAAKASILFRDAQAVENLASADTLVFDKTGTLTYGRLRVTDVIPLKPDWSEDHLLALVASLEEHTHHPFADAVVQHAHAQEVGHIDHGDIQFVVAHGLCTQVEGRQVLVGSRHYLEEDEGIFFAEHRAIIETLEAEGKSLLYVAQSHQPVGLIAERDELRPDAASTLQRLKALSIERLVMLTGDRRDKAQGLAHQLGIKHVQAEMHPEEKAQFIEELKRAGNKVAYVGDG